MLFKIFSVFTLFAQVFSSETNVPSPPIMMGGQRDVNNCLTSAGYNWCEDSISNEYVPKEIVTGYAYTHITHLTQLYNSYKC